MKTTMFFCFPAGDGMISRVFHIYASYASLQKKKTTLHLAGCEIVCFNVQRNEDSQDLLGG